MESQGNREIVLDTQSKTTLITGGLGVFWGERARGRHLGLRNREELWDVSKNVKKGMIGYSGIWKTG